jgi:predicted ATP-grasp superfamily ATP-dependent carboligase
MTVQTATSSHRDRPVAVVLNMHYTGLALARALHGHGFQVYGLSSDPTLFGNASRTIEYHPCPDTEREPAQCRNYLRDFAQRLGRRALLLPTRDHDLNFIRACRAELEEYYDLSLAPNDVLDRILDKEKLFALARSLNVPCPQSFWIHAPHEFRAVPASVAFPCVIKPVSASQWRKPGIWEAVGMRKAVIAETAAELERFYDAIAPLDSLMCVQEFIPGDDTELAILGAYVNARSGAQVWYTARKLLQYPAFAGTGIAVRSAAVPQIVEPSLKLLAAVGYSGPAEVEFKYDRRTGDFKLIEINTRFWDQHALGAACGADLVGALVDDLLHGRARRSGGDGASVTWIAEDGLVTSWLGNRRRREQAPARYREAWRGRKTLAVWSWKDPWPGLRLAGRMLVEGFRLVLGPARPSSHRGEPAVQPK